MDQQCPINEVVEPDSASEPIITIRLSLVYFTTPTDRGKRDVKSTSKATWMGV